MTEHAASTEKQLAAALRCCVARIGRGLALSFGPRREAFRRKCHDVEGHECMLQTAIFGASTLEFTGPVSAKTECGGATRYQVLLTVQIGNPETMDDVVGLERDHDRPPDGKIKF